MPGDERGSATVPGFGLCDLYLDDSNTGFGKFDTQTVNPTNANLNQSVMWVCNVTLVIRPLRVLNCDDIRTGHYL